MSKVLDKEGRKVTLWDKWQIKEGQPYIENPLGRFVQLIEECSELAQAGSKIIRYEHLRDKYVDKDKAYANLLEEIADVEIVLGQVKNLLPVGAVSDIEHIKLEKLSREQQRLMMI